MKKIIFLITSTTLLSCKPTLKRSYESNCFLYGTPEYVLKINDNGKFQFKSFLNDTIDGNWTLSKDTLILDSEYFIEASPFDIEKDSIAQRLILALEKTDSHQIGLIREEIYSALDQMQAEQYASYIFISCFPSIYKAMAEK